MNKNIIVLFQFCCIFSSLAQDRGSEENSNLNITRQGFGVHAFLNMGTGFVNQKRETKGSYYFFDTWDTEGLIYTKDNKRYKVKKVNINMYDNTLDAVYNQNSVFTFDTKYLVKIVVNNSVFRVFTHDKKLKIFELFFKGKQTIYRYNHVGYFSGSNNPMKNRSTNKYIVKQKYYLYNDGELIKIKLSKKSFIKFFQSDTVSKDAISKYIKKNKLSLKNDTDLKAVLKFINN